MTLTIPFTGRRARPRKANRAEVKLARTRTQLAAVRADNARLLTMKAAADDHFMVVADYVSGLEGDVRQLRLDLAAEQGARAVAEKDVETRGRWVADLERKVADLERRLQIGVLAEAAAARTQELDVRSLRERFAFGPVVSLHHSPQAGNPAHVPSWAVVGADLRGGVDA